MTRRSASWKTEISTDEIRAFIVGDGEWVTLLREKLEKRGCTVFVTPTLSSVSVNVNYLFISQDYENIFSVFSKKKFLHTSILVVLQNASASIKSRIIDTVTGTSGDRVRVLIVGDIAAWKSQALSETCIWAMFTGQLGRVLDLSKVSLRSISKAQKQEKNSPRISEVRIPRRIIKFATLVLLFFSPLLALFSLVLFTLYTMYGVYSPLSVGNYKKARDTLPAFQGASRLQDTLTRVVSPLFTIPPLSLVQRYISFSQHGLVFAEDVLDFQEYVSSVQSGYQTNGSIGDKETISALKTSLVETSKSLESFRSSYESLPFRPGNSETYTQQLEELSFALTFAQEAFPFLEHIFSQSGESTYLVLFQNNTELRPTGGFIGSYALLHLRDGVVDSYSFHDVYEADGQLKAHVAPPEPIRTYLSQPNWFLRDSNFDPDFAVSAQQAMWFLEQETGDTVDGVIALNLHAVGRVISSLGDIYLPDYGENITSENFLLRATTESQQEFFPGSTAKRDFLRSLGNAMYYEFLDSPHADYLSAILSISESLEKKDILIYSSDFALQTLVEERGWGGRMVDVSCASEECLADFFMAVDANLGVNKANLYVSRRMGIEKRFSKGELETTARIVYSNESPSQVFPAGTYKNYVRVFLPSDVVVQDIRIDGRSILSETIISVYGGDKREVGFYLEVEPGSEKTVEISSVQSVSTSFSTYEFFLSKQPGEREGSVDLKFVSDPPIRLEPKNFSPTLEGSVYSFVSDSSVDRVFVFDISR